MIGVHFFNPAPVMKLVEIVRTVVTAPEVVADVEALCARLGKVDVTISDRAGFIANALLFGYLNHAVSMFEAHYATREDIDAAMKLGCGLPMGPLALMDLIGLDTAYEILDTMYRRGGRDRRHAPVPLIKQMVTAGLLGRKSGRGFYTYEKPGSPVVVADALPRRPPRPSPRSAWSAPAMAPGIVEVSPSRSTWSVAGAAGRREARSRPFADGRVRGRPRRRAGRITWPPLDHLADVDLVVEAVVEELGGQEGAVRRPRRDLQAGRGARHHHVHACR